MNGSNSRDYYRRRAAQAHALAEAATMPGVRTIHEAMALRYQELADSAEAPSRIPRLSLAV